MVSLTIRKQQFANELQNVGIESPCQPPKIQRVPEHLRNRENIKEHYLPRLLSIGPIHHGSPNLKLGEKYKLMMAAKYIQSNRLNPANLQNKIADNIQVLKGHFDQDVLTLTGKSVDGFRDLDDKLSWMLFVDGCSLLCIFRPDVFNDFKADQIFLLMFLDVILLENQLPYLVLKLLWKNDNEAELLWAIKRFLKIHQFITPNFREDENDNEPASETEPVSEIELRPVQRNNEPVSETEPVSEIELRIVQTNNDRNHLQHIVSMPDESGPESMRRETECVSEFYVHLLDIFRTIVLTQSHSKLEAMNLKSMDSRDQQILEERAAGVVTFRNVQDLKAAGIKFGSSGTRNPMDINYSEGLLFAKLTLPEIVVNNMTAPVFHNLIAYEMCPDFDNNYEICSFASFMDRIIDYPEDVKELRSKGILINRLGSDEEVANLFNIICTDLVEGGIYDEVNKNIEKHYKNKVKTCLAQGIHGSFSSLWTTIGFLAAFMALALTFTQTWFAVNPAS
ncbi:hypothetical protein P8452_01736 [Trifolium repens]|nr:hypothetical protein P8452_01736 [Trifolium repens]